MPPLRRFSLMSTVLLGHAGVVLALLAMPHVKAPAAASSPLSVSLIELAEETARPEPQLPKPRVLAPKVEQKPLPQAPALAVERPAVLASSRPAPAVEAPRQFSEPLPAVLPAIATVAEAPQSTTPSALIEPRYDADYLANPKPPYPFLSRRLGEEGTVHLRVHVNVDGSVAKLELKHGSGYARLDQAAMNTVQNWRFVPARQGAQPVAAWVVVPINFTLRS